MDLSDFTQLNPVLPLSYTGSPHHPRSSIFRLLGCLVSISLSPRDPRKKNFIGFALELEHSPDEQLPLQAPTKQAMFPGGNSSPDYIAFLLRLCFPISRHLKYNVCINILDPYNKIV